MAAAPTPVVSPPSPGIAAQSTTGINAAKPIAPATRPANVPANYTWDPTLAGGGGWVSPTPIAAGTPGWKGGTVNQFSASGQPVNSDGTPYVQGKADPITTGINDGVNAVSGIPTALSGLAGDLKKGVGDVITAVDPSQSADAQTSRDFGSQLRGAYAGFQPAAAPALNTTTLNADQATQRANIARETGIANGTAPTAGDALLQQGTDQAAKNAAGLAAQYSAQNPGMALRQGLAASNNAYAAAAAPAAQLKSQEQQTAMGAIQGAGASLAGQDTTAAGADQQAKIATNAQNNQQQLGLGTLAANQTNAPLNTDIAGAQAKAQLLGAGTSGLGALLASDKRVKKDVKKKSFVDAMADKVHGVTFTYKPEHGGTKHAGVIAQDIEKVFPGVVAKGNDGVKRVDTGHAALATMGVVSELARRLKEIEGKKKNKKAA